MALPGLRSVIPPVLYRFSPWPGCWRPGCRGFVRRLVRGRTSAVAVATAAISVSVWLSSSSVRVGAVAAQRRRSGDHVGVEDGSLPLMMIPLADWTVTLPVPALSRPMVMLPSAVTVMLLILGREVAQQRHPAAARRRPGLDGDRARSCCLDRVRWVEKHDRSRRLEQKGLVVGDGQRVARVGRAGAGIQLGNGNGRGIERQRAAACPTSRRRGWLDQERGGVVHGDPFGSAVRGGHLTHAHLQWRTRGVADAAESASIEPSRR